MKDNDLPLKDMVCQEGFGPPRILKPPRAPKQENNNNTNLDQQQKANSTSVTANIVQSKQKSSTHNSGDSDNSETTQT